MSLRSFSLPGCLFTTKTFPSSFFGLIPYSGLSFDERLDIERIQGKYDRELLSTLKLQRGGFDDKVIHTLSPIFVQQFSIDPELENFMIDSLTLQYPPYVDEFKQLSQNC